MCKAETMLDQKDDIWKIVFDSIDDAAVVINPDFEVELMNRKGQELFGNFPGKKTNKCYEIICKNQEPPANCPSLCILNKTYEPSNHIVQFQDKYFKIKSTPIKDDHGNIIKFVDILHDITTELETQKKLTGQNEEIAALNEEYLTINEELTERNNEYAGLNRKYQSTIIELENKNKTLVNAQKQIEETQKSLKNLESIIQRTPAVAFRWKNQEGWPVEFVSSNVFNVMGYSEIDFTTGRVSYENIIHPNDLSRVKLEVQNSSADQSTSVFTHEPYRIKTKKEKYIWVDDRTYIRRDKDKIIGFDGIIAECTERVMKSIQLKQNEEKFRLIAESSAETIWQLDLSGRITYASPALQNIFGYTSQEAIKLNFSQFFPKNELVKASRVFAAAVKGKKHQVEEFAAIAKDGATVNIEVSVTPIIQKDLIVGVQGITRDITKIKMYREQILEREKRYKSLFNNSLDAILISDDKARFTEANPAALQMLGYSLEELKKCNIFDITSVTDKKAALTLWKNFIKEGTQKGEYVIIDKEGNELLTDYRAVSNVLPGMHVSFLRDITERKKAESQLQFHSMLINNINDFVTATDPDGHITYVNEKVCSVFNKSRDEIIGQHVNMYGDESGYGGNSQSDIVVNTFEKGTWQGEITNVKPNGEKIYLYFRTQLLKDEKGNPMGMIGISTDISERKEYEHQLKEKTEELESQNEEYLSLNEEMHESMEQIQSINEELEKAKKKAEESDRLKSAFLANMSHEIRTPLNGILGFTTLLTSDRNNDFSKKQKYGSIIKKSSESLLQIIDDILDISRIESGELKISERPFDVIPMLHELNAVFARKIMAGVNLYLMNSVNKDKIILHSDESRLRQVFYNLLDNAIKFTEKGAIRFGIRNVLPGKIEFFVQDTGIGIPKSKQKTIFQRFRQGENAYNRMYGGNGLGLAITKNLVELMGGRIKVESAVKKGSEFTFFMPYITAESTAFETKITSGKKEAVTHGHSSKILLVEDDPTTCVYMEEVFDGSNCSIKIACTGKEALDLMKNNRFDVIFMDIGLPDISGIELVKEIRKFNNEVYIVALTAYAMADDKENALQAGCNDYVAKPVKTDIIFQKIEEATSKE